MIKSAILSISFLGLLVGSVAADVTVIDYDVEINGTYDAVSVEADANCIITGGTIGTLYIIQDAQVHLIGGTIDNIYTYDNSSLNISDTAVVTTKFEAYGSSAVGMAGGQVTCNMDFVDYSQFHYYGGIIQRPGSTGSVSANNYSRIYFYDGNPVVGNNFNLYLCNYATGIIFGGTLTNVSAEYNSCLHISGGNIDMAKVIVESVVYLSGGNIANLRVSSECYEFSAGTLSSVHTYGTNLTARPYGGTQALQGSLTGNWLGGSSFSIDLTDQYTYSYLRLHEGQTPPDPEAPYYAGLTGDSNHDGIVNMLDLADLAANWLEDIRQP